MKIELHLALVNHTPHAILVENEHDKEIWIPRSLLTDFKDLRDGTCTFEMEEFIATHKELT